MTSNVSGGCKLQLRLLHVVGSVCKHCRRHVIHVYNVHGVLISESEAEGLCSVSGEASQGAGEASRGAGKKVGSQAASQKYHLFLRVCVHRVHNFPCLIPILYLD